MIKDIKQYMDSIASLDKLVRDIIEYEESYFPLGGSKIKSKLEYLKS